MFVLLSVIFLNALLSRVFKPEPGVFFCGLFGGCFNRPIDEFIINKIKTLGFMNQSRGEHSCGYYNGEKIFKGVLEKKKFIDLVNKDGIFLPDEPTNNVFIGHTRQATYGTHSEENAHPFNVNNNLIIAHNGTIKNIWDLCSKNDVPHLNIHVDSLGLGHLLDKKGYEILNKYEGAAALMVHRLKEPNSLYLYHGASKETENGVDLEERPLFILQAEEGVYVSSLDYALEFIKRANESVKNLPYNRIFRIKNGELQATKYKIDRSSANIKKTTHYYDDYASDYPFKGSVQQGVIYNHGRASQQELVNKVLKEYPSAKIIAHSTSVKEKSEKYDFHIKNKGTVINVQGVDISKETLPIECKDIMTGKIICWKGRFHEVSPDSFKLAHGRYILSKTGIIISPETLLATKEKKPEEYYFYNGVMINNRENYEKIINALLLTSNIDDGSKDDNLRELKRSLTTPYKNFASIISKYSRFPVTLLPTECVEIKTTREYWYQNENLFSSSITPKFASRDYHYKEGLLIRIKATDSSDENVLNITENNTNDSKESKIISLSPVHVTGKKEIDDSFYENIEMPEVDKVISVFKNKYSSIHELSDALGEPGLASLNLYVQDLCTDILKIEATDENCERLAIQHLKDSINTNSTLEATLHADLSDLKSYVMDALILLNEEEDNEKKNKIVPLITDKNFRKLNFNEMSIHALPPSKKEVEEDEKRKKWKEIEEQEEMNEEVNKIAKAQEQNEEAIDTIDEMVDILEDVFKRSFSLQDLNSSALAQECCEKVQIGVNSIVNDLIATCSKNKEHALVRKLNRLTTFS